MHDLCIFLICFCSKIIFGQKKISFCWDKLDYWGPLYTCLVWIVLFEKLCGMYLPRKVTGIYAVDNKFVTKQFFFKLIVNLNLQIWKKSEVVLRTRSNFCFLIFRPIYYWFYLSLLDNIYFLHSLNGIVLYSDSYFIFTHTFYSFVILV